ncbi:PREDICTED: GDP-fucose protein O-fucosyltransferase 2 [Trachymyrmex septentrionalis]|uniref:GDP-fucose protein O-fucosyltransferase 2 n=1 Tax=Trachymyrmex septentrionalis TaxID=34720 RepID=UPI00084F4917|nr:PREDICTED: GDP-fucose protein O-fucosyltransferase 2 [Trachymyrmex septentrionalis]XP_018347462.1 PREDICTED: GDP-fucose protein O-fucosyltransferase 2 [Trachymyrmex septentrionalis]XP_018347463.1 PREDICTED: GDP-fucose protein O-fucosyltransferase 2 [Trachymyrmex septentrionalis]
MSALKVLCSIILTVFVVSGSEFGFCKAPDECTVDSRRCIAENHFTKKRYILYDVNPAEGFNLRRDVYIRIAVFLRKLIERNKEFQWQLILPPWGNLYHWRSRNIGSQERLPWGTFFDITSLQLYIPVIEMYEFVEEYSCGNREVQLDRLYILQNDEEMFKTGKFEDKNELIDCDHNSLRYHKLKQHMYTGPFWGYSNITARDVKCLKFHGMAQDLSQNLMPTRYRSVMFDRMEIALHDEYGSKEYWRARRSMRYSSELYDIAEDYRKTFLNSMNENDNTERPADWTKEKNRRNAKGGPYLAVHLRRRDFIMAHKASVPTIMNTALQLQKRMAKLGLTLLFIATDAEQYEFEELKLYLPQYKVMKYVPSDYVINKFKDGGVAIIDQIICSYARYFIGTHESTFTFRIQEDREIIGFPSDTTFNKLCKTNEDCTIDGFWSIVW